MRRTRAASSSLAPRGRTAEHVLLPAGSGRLTRQALEARCLPRLARLLRGVAVWRSEDHGVRWKPGDYNILIVETTVAPDASLYVQFWSEPGQPTLCEVSSGTPNPGARRYVTTRARRLLQKMGFEIVGEARNFGKPVLIRNAGDAHAAARDVLRIFHEGFDYRGTTPLVARVIMDERAGRAVVHDRFTREDIVNLLHREGYAAKASADGEPPLVFANVSGVHFVIALDVPAGGGCFRCLDVTGVVGHVEEETERAWLAELNQLNARARVVRGWIDADRDVMLGASVMCARGVTQDYVADQVAAWRHAAELLLSAPPKATTEDDDLDDEGANDAREGSPRARSKRPAGLVH